MNNKKIQDDVLKRVEKLLNNLEKQRLRDIIERRFGLKNGNRETLEKIGQDYNITRERVRQIESGALQILNQQKNLKILEPIFNQLHKIFEENSHLIGEERLLNSIAKTNQSHPSKSAVILVLHLGKPYQRFPEDEKFHPHWVVKKTARQKVEKIVDFLINYLAQKEQPHSDSDIFNIATKRYKSIDQNIILNALDIAKTIDKNAFGEVGLNHWPNINPRGVKDKAYLVLRKENEPKHFIEITNLINKAGFNDSQAYPQTVHNELIKDDRFVLVGRGIYGLAEHGYAPGMVKDIIKEVLKSSNRPLTKKEVISAVLRQRKVKPNTVIINLQNHPEFKRLEVGKYTLK